MVANVSRMCIDIIDITSTSQHPFILVHHN